MSFSFSFPAAFRTIAVISAILFGPTLGSARTCAVTVYGWITDAGKFFPAPSEARPARCALVTNGYVERGTPGAVRSVIDQHEVARLVIDGLAVNHFVALPDEEGAADLLLVYHWGRVAPVLMPAEPGVQKSATGELLALVGGRALGYAMPGRERQDILLDAADERYFVIVSAYAAPIRDPKERTLFWRTHISVPTSGLSLDAAIPLLLATGASLFGRETPLPRRISVELTGVLRPISDVVR